MGDQCSSGAIIGHVGISFSVQCAGEWHCSFWSRLQWTTLIGVAFFGDAQSANLTPCLNWLSWGFYSEKYIKAARTSLSRYPYREWVTAPDAESWLWPSCESICGYNRRSWVIHVACPFVSNENQTWEAIYKMVSHADAEYYSSVCLFGWRTTLCTTRIIFLCPRSIFYLCFRPFIIILINCMSSKVARPNHITLLKLLAAIPILPG